MAIEKLVEGYITDAISRWYKVDLSHSPFTFISCI